MDVVDRLFVVLVVGTKGVSQNHLLSFDDNKVLKLSIGYAKHLFKVYMILIKALFIKGLIEQVKEQRNFLLKLKASERTASEEMHLKKALKTRHQKQGHQKQGYQKHLIRSHFTRSLSELTKYNVRIVQPLTMRMSLQPPSLQLVSTSRQE